MDTVLITLSRWGRPAVWLFPTRSYYLCRLRNNQTTPLGAIEPNELLRKLVVEVLSVYVVLRIVWEEVLQRPVATVKFGELLLGQGLRVPPRSNFPFLSQLTSILHYPNCSLEHA